MITRREFLQLSTATLTGTFLNYKFKVVPVKERAKPITWLRMSGHLPNGLVSQTFYDVARGKSN